jgi:hypothetical protein
MAVARENSVVADTAAVAAAVAARRERVLLAIVPHLERLGWQLGRAVRLMFQGVLAEAELTKYDGHGNSVDHGSAVIIRCVPASVICVAAVVLARVACAQMLALAAVVCVVAAGCRERGFWFLECGMRMGPWGPLVGGHSC